MLGPFWCTSWCPLLCAGLVDRKYYMTVYSKGTCTDVRRQTVGRVAISMSFIDSVDSLLLI